jgi:hypothetical protein
MRYSFILLLTVSLALSLTLGAVENTVPAPLSPSSASALSVSAASEAYSDAGVLHYETYVVQGRSLNLLGKAEAASEGRVGSEDLQHRPLSRPGELAEVVPGLVVSQHSGDGKANQFYARGFNLDHGTDFASWIDGMPVNLRTHGHGQGYTDLNFLIPELVETVDYRKGPYSVHDGDFSAVGAVNFNYTRDLRQGLLLVGMGPFGYRRALAAASPQVGPGTLLLAVENFDNDGPWDVPQHLLHRNLLAKYSARLGGMKFSLTGLSYDAEWTATDQVPQRAIEQGLIGRYGSLDPSDGGITRRRAGSLQWEGALGDLHHKGSAYVFDSGLRLWSNFTLNLVDPVNGDQIEQQDERTTFGGHWAFWHQAQALEARTELGVELRQDNIYELGLWNTRERQRLSAVGTHSVNEGSVAAYLGEAIKPLPWLRLHGGVRYDAYTFKVDATTNTVVAALNSGTVNAGIFSPKAGLALGPWAKTEFYLSWGQAFHSNDARGITQAWADSDGNGILDPVETVTPLVKIQGSEVGVRTSLLPGLTSTLSLWQLDFDSELVFVGDAQTTEAGRSSRRWGVEWTNYYKPLDWLILDLDYSWSHARYTQADPAGDYIPGALEDVLTAGATLGQDPWQATLRARYFGPRPLLEDNSVRSSGSLIWSLRLAAKPWKGGELSVDVLNLFDVKASDIEYYYPSLLAGETPVDDTDGDGIPDAVNDIHLHPAEPRQVRVTLAQRF